jgi:hypothetical protein
MEAGTAQVGEAVTDGKYSRQSMKSAWIITYGASSAYISPQMLLELGKLNADECHSTKDRAMAYTYIHLTKRVRQTSIDKFMCKAREVHGIVKNEVFGYDAIVSNSRSLNDPQIEEHIALHMLVRHFVTKNPAFQPCTDGEPVLKRGLILKISELDHEKPAALEGQTKTKIIEYTQKLESKLKEAEKQAREIYATYVTVSEERSNLRVENAMLKRKIQQLEGQTT